MQRIPGTGGTQAQIDETALDAAWHKADAAMSGLAPGQLLEDDVEQRLPRHFGVDEVRVFSGHDVQFECRCSRERVANVLRSLGAEEVRIGDRGAGHVHGNLRVLSEAVQVRRDRRRAFVYDRSRRRQRQHQLEMRMEFRKRYVAFLDELSKLAKTHDEVLT